MHPSCTLVGLQHESGSATRRMGGCVDEETLCRTWVGSHDGNDERHAEHDIGGDKPVGGQVEKGNMDGELPRTVLQAKATDQQ